MANTIFDINNFAIDRVLRGVMVSTADGSVMWSINQITDPSLNVTAETAEVVDALGTPIVTFNRGKQAEFTANNSLFDLGLYAAQQGNEKEVATETKKILSPAFETIDIENGATAVTLKNIPCDAKGEPVQITEIFSLNGDGTFGTKYVVATEASDTEFAHTAGAKEITIPTDLKAGDQLFVMYEYQAERAVAVTGDAINFPKAGKFIMEVLGTDVCDVTTLVHAYIIFPNAKLDANVDVSFTTDGNHPFTLQAQQAYCDKEKVLFKVIIPDEE